MNVFSVRRDNVYSQIRDNVEDKGIAELIRVSGIGPAKARDLVKAGITSIDDLKKNQDKLTHHQLIGLK